MARIFDNCHDMILEMDRELKLSGITTPVKHYQNIELEGDDQLTKELIGVNFIILHPLEGHVGMFTEIFGERQVGCIMRYCEQELLDRTSPFPLNPGNSWKIREDLWQKLMSRDREGKFDYTYSERLANNHQLYNVIETLKEDPNSRRAMVMIFDPEDTLKSKGASTRIPCSISYQFLIRNDKLMVLYYIRSNDYYKHFPIDIVMTSLLQEWVRNKLLDTYPDLKLGSLNYFAGSLHAYKEDLDKHVVF